MPKDTKSRNRQWYLARLHEMRDFGGAALTTGLDDNVIREFLENHPQLGIAIERAFARFLELKQSHADYLELDESKQISQAHAGLTNFYADDAVNPYVAASAAGPWVISLKGAVIYDCGGYGMLGLGHAPEAVQEALNKPHVMANIMTANLSQVEFTKSMRQEVGHTREGGTPYASFLCLNSGSEAMSIASRIAD
ncbi:MAG: aminotransferase class III-fold pyridoxal phosphate-dependent enzyme, partial [Woeseiaceae bacterium]